MQDATLPQASTSTKRQHQHNALFWLAFAIIYLAGIWVYATGYDYGLPIYEHIDERRNLYEIYMERGFLDYDTTKPGYPPGVLWINHAAQYLTEAQTGISAYRTPAEVIRNLRIFAVVTSLTTALLAGLMARQLGGNLAGLMGLAGWLFAPHIFRFASSGLPQTWEAWTYALTGYLALLALSRKSPRWAIASLIASLGAVIFKYSSVPVMGLPVGVALWYMWREDWRRWGAVLAVQTILSVAVALWLFLGVGAYDLALNNPEPNRFIEGGPVNMANPVLNGYLFNDMLLQIGWPPFVDTINDNESPIVYALGNLSDIVTAVLVLGGVLIGGSLLYLRWASTWQRLGWVMIAGSAVFHVWFLSSYIIFLRNTDRYHLPISTFTVVTAVVAVASIGDWLSRRSGRQWLRYVWISAFCAVWLGSQFVYSVNTVTYRDLPLIQAGFQQWAGRTMADGNETVMVSDSITFDKRMGGYVGPTRPWYEVEDFMSEPLDHWREDMRIFYAQIPDRYIDDRMATTADGQATLDDMLLIKRFPPPSQIGQWRGEPTSVFWLWPIQNDADAMLGDSIRFRGYDLDGNIAASGEISLRLFWQALAQPDVNYQTFLHVVPMDNRDTLFAQADVAPAKALRPTTTWDDPDEILISDLITLPLPDDLPAGDYRLTLGLYDLASGQRLLTEMDADYLTLDVFTIEG